MLFLNIIKKYIVNIIFGRKYFQGFIKVNISFFVVIIDMISAYNIWNGRTYKFNITQFKRNIGYICLVGR